MVDPATDTNVPVRPWAFECPYGTVVSPTRTQENPNCPQCNSGPTGISQCNTVRTWRYSEIDIRSDRRVAYTNANYPWIQGM